MPHATPPRSRSRRSRILSCTALLALTALPLATNAQTGIPSGAGNFNANTAGSYILNTGNTRSNTGGTEVISIGSATGPYTLTIDGTVSQTGTGRGIRSSNNNVTFNLTVGSTGRVQAISDDAIQARNGTFNVTNNGTIYSGPNIVTNPITAIATGQALDLASAVGGTVINNATGVIRADGHDAVRLGSNMTMTNYGTIRGNSVVNDSPANNSFNTPAGSTLETYSAAEGVSFENGSNSSLNNYGSISGSRHGVETDVSAINITVTNQATGEMIGRNGSGIGSDATSASLTNVTVHNYGLIRGDYAGAGNVIDRTGSASPTNDGDGDGVDIDGAATINNYATGQIIGNGAGGFDSSGRANTSDGISIGGGVINNVGLIRGAGAGIVVNNDSVLSRSGVAASTITNNFGATIEGLNGYAIRLENKLGDARDNDVITNSGTIIGGGSIPNPTGTVLRQNNLSDPNSTGTLDGVSYTGTGSIRFVRGDGSAIQMGEGNDTLTNTGTITGNTGRAVNMEGGNDTLNHNGGAINGTINGGVGTDTLNLGAGVAHSSATQNIENINVASGSASLAGVVSGTTLTKGGNGTLVLSGANDYTGTTTVSTGKLVVNNVAGSGTGSGPVVVQNGATLGGTGIFALATSTTSIDVQSDVTFHIGGGRMTVGNGSLNVDGLFIFDLNGTIAGTAGGYDQLQFSLENTGSITLGGSSALQLNLNFAPVLGQQFELIDVGNGGAFITGTFAGLADGAFFSQGGQQFQISYFGGTGNDLVVTAIPEPSTTAAILGLLVFSGVAAHRAKKRRTAVATEMI